MSTEHDKALRIEKLTTFAHFDRCVEMQNTVWGYEPSDAMSQKVFLLASQIGGQVLGAFEGEDFVGYAMALPGRARWAAVSALPPSGGATSLAQQGRWPAAEAGTARGRARSWDRADGVGRSIRWRSATRT